VAAPAEARNAARFAFRRRSDGDVFGRFFFCTGHRHDQTEVGNEEERRRVSVSERPITGTSHFACECERASHYGDGARACECERASHYGMGRGRVGVQRASHYGDSQCVQRASYLGLSCGCRWDPGWSRLRRAVVALAVALLWLHHLAESRRPWLRLRLAESHPLWRLQLAVAHLLRLRLQLAVAHLLRLRLQLAVAHLLWRLELATSGCAHPHRCVRACADCCCDR
jgi:hypothetical protein